MNEKEGAAGRRPKEQNPDVVPATIEVGVMRDGSLLIPGEGIRNKRGFKVTPLNDEACRRLRTREPAWLLQLVGRMRDKCVEVGFFSRTICADEYEPGKPFEKSASLARVATEFAAKTVEQLEAIVTVGGLTAGEISEEFDIVLQNLRDPLASYTHQDLERSAGRYLRHENGTDQQQPKTADSG